VVAGGDPEDLLGARDLSGVEDRGGKPGVVAVAFGLAGAVDVHLEERLGEELAAVVVLPAGIEDAAVVGHGGEVGVDLVEAEAAEALAVLVAGVEVGDLGPPAVDGLDAAGGAEDDVAVGEAGGLVVGVAESVGELADPLRGDVDLIEVVVVLPVVLLPGEDDLGPVVGDVGVADDALGVVDERGDLAVEALLVEEAEGAAGDPVALGLGVALALGVGVVAAADVPVLGEDELRPLGEEGLEALRAAGLAGLDVEVLPAGVAALGGAQRVHLGPERGGVPVQLLEDRLDQRLLGLGVVLALEDARRRLVLHQPVAEDEGLEVLALELLGECPDAEADVDELAAGGLLAVDGEGVGTGLEGGLAGRGEGDGDVPADEALALEGEGAVDVDLDVLVVEDVGLEVAGGDLLEVERPAQPDVGGAPRGARAVGVAEPARSLLPCAVVELGLLPAGRRGGEGVAPRLGLLL
jgi:hypothetical protein